MVKWVLQPERHEDSILYSCSAHWASLAPLDSVLCTCLRITSPHCAVSYPRARRPRPQGHGMVGRVLRPERHEGSKRYSCSVHWTSLAQADSVLCTCLRITSPHCAVSYPRARRLHPQGHGMVGRVLRPERHEDSILYSCSAPWASLAPLDSVLCTSLRITSPQS